MFSTPGGPWAGPLGENAGLAPTLPEDVPEDHEMGDGELPTESRGKSTDATEEPSMASPRLIPIPESPTSPGEPAAPSIMGGAGSTSVSFGQQHAPPLRLRSARVVITAISPMTTFAICASRVVTARGMPR